tara:strand:- start:123 stop:497 length:375 start_codon:yes stop_codon:yes gene_type:complete
MVQFPKKEKLCSKKEIESLFANGQSILEPPFRIIWNFEKNNENVFLKCLIIVSKKKIKLAVDRNLLKRRIREAYRVNKKKLESFLENSNRRLNLAIIYQKEFFCDSKTLEQKINLLLTNLIDEL